MTPEEPAVVQNVWMAWLGLNFPNDLESIVGLLDRLPVCVREAPWALIASVDSGRGAYVGEKFRRATQYGAVPGTAYTVLADGCVVLDSLTFQQLARSGEFFSDFDEVWFFGERPHEGPPAGVQITSEAPINSAAYAGMRNSLVNWVLESGTLLGLGDGAGLNFATPDEATAKALMELSSLGFRLPQA